MAIRSFKETGQGRAVRFQSPKVGYRAVHPMSYMRASGEQCSASMLWMAVRLIEAQTAQNSVHMQGAAHTRDAGLRKG